jgi:hypothetical protein
LLDGCKKAVRRFLFWVRWTKKAVLRDFEKSSAGFEFSLSSGIGAFLEKNHYFCR